jgi:hypothetical protein
MPLSSKASLSHVIVDNSHGLPELTKGVQTCYERLVRGNAFEAGLDFAKILWPAMAVGNDDGAGAFVGKILAAAYFVGMAGARGH